MLFDKLVSDIKVGDKLEVKNGDLLLSLQITHVGNIYEDDDLVGVELKLEGGNSVEVFYDEGIQDVSKYYSNSYTYKITDECDGVFYLIG